MNQRIQFLHRKPEEMLMGTTTNAADKYSGIMDNFGRIRLLMWALLLSHRHKSAIYIHWYIQLSKVPYDYGKVHWLPNRSLAAKERSSMALNFSYYTVIHKYSELFHCSHTSTIFIASKNVLSFDGMGSSSCNNKPTYRMTRQTDCCSTTKNFIINFSFYVKSMCNTNHNHNHDIWWI